MVCVRYRPRQPRASPVWQVLHDHAAKLPGLSREATGAINAFLDCGDLHAGFTCLHCPDCGDEFLLAFSCKQRGLCASCTSAARSSKAPSSPTRSAPRCPTGTSCSPSRG